MFLPLPLTEVRGVQFLLEQRLRVVADGDVHLRVRHLEQALPGEEELGLGAEHEAGDVEQLLEGLWELKQGQALARVFRVGALRIVR